MWLVGVFEEHAFMPLGPLRVQVMLPTGATEPAVPVTTAVNVSVEPRDVPPLAVSTTDGDVLAITTVLEETEAKFV